jgi:RNA polymerase sigma-70 factor (ECF subfamily)
VETEAPDTRSLLELARAGDAGAFGEICRVYETRLLRHAMGLCGNATLAEELAQDTLVEAWKSLHRYHGGCQFFTWLCAILLNRYRNTLRQKRPLPLSSLTGGEQAEVQDRLAGLTDHGSPPDQAAQLHEQAGRVRACLAALPPKHQQVIYLRFYVDDSLEEIAGAMGCSVGTVKSRLFNALEKLRRMNALTLDELESKGQPKPFEILPTNGHE